MRVNKKSGNIFWGLLLIAAAVYVVASQLWELPHIDIFRIAAGILCVYIFGKGLKEVNFTNMIGSAAAFYVIFDKPLGWPVLPVWTVAGACILLIIGLSLIFPQKRKRQFELELNTDDMYATTENWNDGVVRIANMFGETIKYLNCDNFRGGELENKFGELTVYFDNTVIAGGQAKIYIENSFGETELYIPKEWNVINNMSHSFGDISEKGRYDGSAGCTLIIEGTASFGEIEIHYI